MRARARVVDGQLALWSPQWWPCRRGRPEADLADCIRKGLIRTGSYVAGTIQFLCPITGRRARVLYLPAGGGTVFASRQASRLAYRSQRASPEDRAIERSLKARKKLGVADQNMLDMPCPRPKWMRDRTYRRLVGVMRVPPAPNRLHGAAMAWNAVVTDRFLRRAEVSSAIQSIQRIDLPAFTDVSRIAAYTTAYLLAYRFARSAAEIRKLAMHIAVRAGPLRQSGRGSTAGR